MSSGIDVFALGNPATCCGRLQQAETEPVDHSRKEPQTAAEAMRMLGMIAKQKGNPGQWRLIIFTGR